MKVVRESSHFTDAQTPTVKLIEALIAYTQLEPEIERICMAVWPACEIYKGHTHWRIMPEGQTQHVEGRPSIYVDLTKPKLKG